MKQKKCPTLAAQGLCSSNENGIKDIQKFSNRQIKAIELLKSGRFSAAEISKYLFCSSGRDVVRGIIAKGVAVCDEWVSSKDARFKKYWIP